MIKSQLSLNVAGQFFHLPHRVVEKAVDVVLDEIVMPHGRLMLTVLGGLAEFERYLILSRTNEGRFEPKHEE